MSDSFLQLRFLAGEYGMGMLHAHAVVGVFAGEGEALFDVEQIERFAIEIALFPLPIDPGPSLAGGTWKKPKILQEHLAMTAYPIGDHGSIALQIRMADSRYYRQHAQLEIVTTAESIARFSRHLVSLVRGTVADVLLKGEI